MDRIAPTAEVLIVGYGLEYCMMGLNALRSVRETNPSLRTKLVTNMRIPSGPFDQWVDEVVFREEPSDRNRLIKTSALDFTSSDHLLYLDADVEVVGDLSPAWILLERFDVLLQAHPVPVHKPFELGPGIPGAVFPYFSGGMLFLRNERPAKDFLANWRSRLIESGLDRDQPALARTVYDLPETRLLVLNSIWQLDVQHLDELLLRDPLFRRSGNRPMIVHHHDAHRDRAYAERLREVVDMAEAAVSPAVANSHEFIRVREKVHRASSKLFANRLTRHPYLAVVNRLGKRRHGVEADVLFRRNETKGAPFRPNAAGLWAEER